MNQPTKTISATDFKQLAQGQALPRVIDVRTPVEVSAQALAGSAHFPLQELNCAAVKSYLAEQGHDPAHPVYLLCASGQRATRAAEQLKGDLDCQLVVIEGGINALNSAGVAIEKGSSNVISLERQVRIAAGSMVVVGVVLGTVLNPWFYALAGFVGAGLVFAGVTDTCGIGMMLARMPWNNVSAQK